jgi:tetratricopeptide (TPR) repeat protein
MSRFGRLEFDDLQGRSEVTAAQVRSLDLADDRDGRHWLRIADEERRGGLFENALRHYSRALELDKSVVAGWTGQAQMLLALGENPEAELWSRKALEMFRNNAELLATRAQALCRTGDLKSAQASCDAAIGQQGMYAGAWVARGELMTARREKLDVYCFDKAAQLDPDWLVPLEVAGIYLHYDRPAKALGRVRQAVEKAPDQAYCWYCQGVCERELGLYAASGRSFDRCLELVPSHVEAGRALHELNHDRRTVRRFFMRWFGGRSGKPKKPGARR